MKPILKRSRRARYMRLRVLPGGTVVLTVPYMTSHHAIASFVSNHALWIERAVARMRAFVALPVSGKRAYMTHKEEARCFIETRVSYWNAFYNHPVNRIAIKNTKRLWGSCSRKGNLNFSYSLLFLPRELADYVVVHEICHLKEHNHAPSFWREVARTLPNYDALRKELRRYQPSN